MRTPARAHVRAPPHVCAMMPGGGRHRYMHMCMPHACRQADMLLCPCVCVWGGACMDAPVSRASAPTTTTHMQIWLCLWRRRQPKPVCGRRHVWLSAVHPARNRQRTRCGHCTGVGWGGRLGRHCPRPHAPRVAATIMAFGVADCACMGGSSSPDAACPEHVGQHWMSLSIAGTRT